jgi:polysaccharide export outer membrane protein
MTKSTSGMLHPGDVVRLQIWREPDMSGDYPVDDRGNVTLPRLGARHVTDIPPDSLRRGLVAQYQQYLEHSSVDVTLLRRIRVVGAVAKPGLYPVDPTMAPSDAIALAGGVTPNGRTDRIDLWRGGTRTTITLNALDQHASLHLQSGDALVVPSRSWIARNVVVIPATITALVSLANFLRH